VKFGGVIGPFVSNAMNTTFTNTGQADIHFVYGYCNGSAKAAVEQRQQRFSNRRAPNTNVFIRVGLRLREKVTALVCQRTSGTISHW
jgi:hypothetical protein